ncbi:MAG: chemotaxis protein CheX [Terriglobales bacterium]|jgi:chemotaxis protein CheX
MTTPEVTNNSETVAPRSEWWGVLRDATVEVFSMMAAANVVVPHAGDDPVIVAEPADSSVLAYVTGMIGIAGAMRAVFSLRCSEATATKLASHMLGVSEEEAAEQRSDAIGEICNMIAGHFKHQIGLGAGCTLSVPTVVMGGNYSIHCLEAGERIEFPAIYDSETLLITLDIRGSNQIR